MDGNQNNTPELPAPVNNTPEKVADNGEHPSVSNSPEKQAVVGEALRQQQPALPAISSNDASQIAQPSSTLGVIPVKDDNTKSQQSTADDADVIEKQWVERAKAIVTKTRNDPREQSHELSRFKAEYVQKRFNKELKISEDAN